MATDRWQDYLKEHQERFLDELQEFLRIPSISALPDHRTDVENAGQWVAQRLVKAGIEHVEVLPTEGHPVVYGDWLHAPGKPTLLIYGHFDVQPVDPVELWSSPPFEPVVRDGRIYARGASDDKGNMLAPILATEALLATTRTLPLNVKFLIEGQEEIGSPDLPPFMKAEAPRFAADMAVSADGSQWSEQEPAIWVSLRGLCAIQINVRGPSRDLHSGLFGGAVQNPVHALVRLLDSMRSPDGRVLVEGFYDEVRAPDDRMREELARVPYEEQELLSSIGISETFGEPGYSTYEREWIRPTLEINGIWGGFQGDGMKTVLPRQAHAKITCRLVADQDPERVIEAVSRHVAANTPPGVEAEVVKLGSSAKPYSIPIDHPGNASASRVHQELYGMRPYVVGSGGSIATCGLILDHLGIHTVNLSFGLDDECAHSPDEFFRLASFQRAQSAHARFIEIFAGGT